MISKELLSEVLGIKILAEVSDDDLTENNILVYWEFDESGNDCRNINIYELAHKCKEWANKTYRIDIYTDIDGMYKVIADDGEILQDRYADTEPEAIFKACQWILEQKAKAVRGMK